MQMQDHHQLLMFRAAQISLWGNIILFVLKATALVFVHSLAILTDLGITVVGLAVSIILYYSLKLANRPADGMHNYGYGKIENVCEAMEGVVLIGIAMVMSFQALTHFIHTKEITAPWLGFWFSVVGAGINFGGAAWILSLAKLSDSPAVRAEGVHYRLEGVISVTVAISFLLTVLFEETLLRPWAVYLDPAAALAVSIIVAVPSFGLAQHAFFKLLDASLEEKGKLKVMKQLAKYMDLCCEFRDIRSRSAGRKSFVEVKLVLPKQMPFSDAYRLGVRVEQDLVACISNCEATVGIVPCDEDCVFPGSAKKCPYC